jgi:hypothetical protein
VFTGRGFSRLVRRAGPCTASPATKQHGGSLKKKEKRNKTKQHGAVGCGPPDSEKLERQLKIGATYLLRYSDAAVL